MSFSDWPCNNQDAYEPVSDHDKFVRKLIQDCCPILTCKQQNAFSPTRTSTNSTSASKSSSNTQFAGTTSSLNTELSANSPEYASREIERTTQRAQYFNCPPSFPSVEFMNPSYATNMVSFEPSTTTLVHDETTQFIEVEEEPYDNAETNDGCGHYCTEPNCSNETAFTRLSDLKRHQRGHSGAKHRYHCGCCDNMGNVPTYCSHRKDRMKQHIGKKHSRKGFEVCKTAPCNEGIELAFSSKSCLLLHKRENHGLTESEEKELNSEITAALSSNTVATGCLRFHIPLPPSKRVKRNDNEVASVAKRRVDMFLKDSKSKTNIKCPTQNVEVSGFSPQYIAGIGEWSEGPEEVPSSLFEVHTPHLSTPSIPEYVSLDVENVPPSEFLIGLEALRYIQAKLVERSLQIEIPAKETYISYSFFKKTLKIHGPVLEAEKAKAEVENKVCFVRKKAVSSNLQVHGVAERAFELRAEEDANLITTWEKHVLPTLPKILRPVVGNDYSACIVRKGPDKKNTVPHIQIESPDVPSTSNRKAIKRALGRLYRHKLGVTLPKVHFSKGRVACLGLEFRSDEDDDTDYGKEEEEDDEEEEDSPFRFEKTYWEKLGMSGSVGLVGSKSVSATSGGYILVDRQLRLLLPDHFVKKSIDRLDKKSQKKQDPIRFTSPSLVDVRECRDRLQRTLEKHRAMAEAIFERGLEDLSIDFIGEFVQDKGLDTILQSCGKEEINEIVLSKRLLQELDRKEDYFRLGHITDRCSVNGEPRLRECMTPKPGEEGINTIKMDWALGDVTAPGRQGRNQHRYRPLKGSCELDYGKEELGNICEYPCPLKPGAEVHYVGCTSGLRRGIISTSRMLVVKDGSETSEWYMIPDQEEGLESHSCAGDSGAWVITDSGNYLMAQLWGYSSGKLLISSIEEVFKDIKEITGAKTVELPNLHNYPHPDASPYEEICRVVSPSRATKKRPCGFNNQTLPSLEQVLKDMGTVARPKPPTINGEAPARQKPAARPTLPGISLHVPPTSPAPNSPVPSLTSSVSSQDRKSPTPGFQRCPTTPTLPSSEHLPSLHNATEPFILRAAETGFSPELSQEPDSLEEKWHNARRQQTEQEATGWPKKKITVESMLDSMPNKEVIRAVTDRVIAMPRPVKPPKKSGTFPLFSNSSVFAPKGLFGSDPVNPPIGLFGNMPMPASKPAAAITAR